MLITKKLTLLIITLFMFGCATENLLPPIDSTSFREVKSSEKWWKDYVKTRLSIKNWQLEGGFKTNDKKAIVSGLNFNWIEEDGTTDVYYFTTSFGVQVASINYLEATDALSLTLGGTFYDATESRQELKDRGLSTPLDMIRFWIRGIPDPRYASKIWVHPDKTIAKLEQLGIEVYFTQFLPNDGRPAEFFIVEKATGLVLAMYVYSYYEE